MISNFKQNIERIGEEERKAREQISAAEVEREDILRKTREAIKREVKDYEDEQRQWLKDETTKLNATEVKQEEAIKTIKKEMASLVTEFDTSKSKVLDFILKNTLDVDLSIPDVVKGQFSKKMGNSK